MENAMSIIKGTLLLLAASASLAAGYLLASAALGSLSGGL